ncbi:MAG: TIGR00645 family protein [Hyphomicrobiaceae bacterium]
MKTAEVYLERVILGSRWVLAFFCLGLAAALFIYAIAFAKKFLKIALHVFDMADADIILAMLNLIDGALVASLMVMVMISSYENFVSRFDDPNAELSWLGKLDTGSLKIKIASAIIAISSIHLLQIFLNVHSYPNDKVMWAMLLHLTFIASAVFLGLIERIHPMGHGKHADDGDGEPRSSDHKN